MSTSLSAAQVAMREYREQSLRRCLVRLAHGCGSHRLSLLVGDLADAERQLQECAEAWSRAAKALDRVVARVEADFDKRTEH